MKRKMKAAILYKPLDLRVEYTDVPKIGSNQVLIKVKAAGICSSDVHYYRTGKSALEVKEPLILGHECSGIVEEVGDDVANLSVGDKVTIEPGFPDRTCKYCKEGRYNLCDNIRFYGAPHFNGAFAEYVVADADFVYRLPENISFEEGALIEPLAVGIYAAKRGEISPGKTVAIFGAGPIGLMCIQAAKSFGASKIISFDILDYLLEAASLLGADVTANPSKIDPLEVIMQETNKIGADVVIEATGVPNVINACISAVRKGGTIVQVGIFPDVDVPVNLRRIVSKEIEYKGAFRYCNVFPLAINLLKSGAVKLKPLITHRLSLNEIHKGLEIFEKKLEKVIKVIIVF